VVEAPGLGDDVQAIKAGVLEIADILVVNKADREGAEHTRRALQMMLDLGDSQRLRHHGRTITVAEVDVGLPPESDWQPLICSTVAVRGEGVPELIEAISDHRRYLEDSGVWAERERERAVAELERLLREQLLRRLTGRIGPTAIEQAIAKIVARQLDAHTAADELLADAGLI
jgi:LAO/AO transport system kinase